MLFNSTPNFLYPDFKVAGKFKLSKNLFRRVRARDSFNAVYASSKQYTIKPGETPDSIAHAAYDDPEKFWAILLLNNITNMNTEWPLDHDQMDVYINEKYGSTSDDPRHWETTEIKDSKQNIVLEAGIVIEMYTNSTTQKQSGYYPKVFNQAANSGNGAFETWSFTYRDVTSFNDQDEPATFVDTTVTAQQNLTKVTNREYEYSLNELKKLIYLPTTLAISIMEDEIAGLLEYSTEYKITDDGYRISEKV
jgi:hypothetical protein|tara:strand:+ start:4500 stop:5249 length:750 start_codon:yes stop_codon:yes gene_type:complete